MTDDPTAGNWQPLADQPIDPGSADTAPLGNPPRPAEESPAPWKAPAYGPPPAEPIPGPPPHAPAYGPPPEPIPAPPPYAPAFGSPPGERNPWAPPDARYPHVDYLESPPRRSLSPKIVVAIVVVLALALAGAGAAVFAPSTHNRSSASSALPSLAASPSPRPSPLPSAQAAPPTPPPSPVASAGPLDSYLLAPGEVGPGVQMALYPDGRGLQGQLGTTLDFCNYHYTSESSRTTRVQVTYLDPSRHQQVSNEFVRYRPGGAASAFAELTKAASTCPSSFQESQGQIASHIERSPGPKGLVTDHLVVSFSVTTTGLGASQTQWTTAVYQFDGDYFSGVYVWGSDKTQVEQWATQLAVKAAKHIAEAAAGKPGTGGGPIRQNGNSTQQPGEQA